MEQEMHDKTRRRISWWLSAGLAVAAVILLLPLIRGGSGAETEEVSLRMFAQEVEAGQAERIAVKGDKLTLERSDGTEIESRKEEGTRAIETLQLWHQRGDLPRPVLAAA